MELQELLDLKDEITEAKNKEQNIKGQITALTAQLKTDWGCTSVKEAKKKIDSMEEKIEELKIKIEEGEEELNEKYPMEG